LETNLTCSLIFVAGELVKAQKAVFCCFCAKRNWRIRK